MSKIGFTGVPDNPQHLHSDLTGVDANIPPAIDGVVRTRFLFDASNKPPGYDIDIREQTINGMLSPDVATITLHESTPVQLMTGDNQITEIFLRTASDAPVGIVLMDPDGHLIYDVYDPLTDGGPHGYTIGKGWMMQTIVGEGGWLEYLDYWSPRGYCDPVISDDPAQKEKMYGETVVQEIAPENVADDFVRVRDGLTIVINTLTKMRI